MRHDPLKKYVHEFELSTFRKRFFSFPFFTLPESKIQYQIMQFFHVILKELKTTFSAHLDLFLLYDFDFKAI